MTLANLRHVGHANDVVALTSRNRTQLYALTGDHRLWQRQAGLTDVNWTLLGSAGAAVTIAGAYDFYATNASNQLLETWPPGSGPWRVIGHANDVVAMTYSYYAYQFFAATSDDRLWLREHGDHHNWTHIGHANDVVALAATGGKGLDGTLVAATTDGRIWLRDAAPMEMNWLHIDTVKDVSGLAAINQSRWLGQNPTEPDQLYLTKNPGGELWSAGLPTLPWTARPRGRLHAPEGDLIDYLIEPGVVAADIVEFVLTVGPGVLANKIMTLPDGLGSSWDLTLQGNLVATNSLWAHQVDNGQQLTFKKPKGFGVIADVLYRGQLGGLAPGSRVTFTWALG